MQCMRQPGDSPSAAQMRDQIQEPLPAQDVPVVEGQAAGSLEQIGQSADRRSCPRGRG